VLCACAGARLVYVTPGHQFPLGTTMILARRLELLDWARKSGAIVFEDDYDSEFRYSGRPVPALQCSRRPPAREGLQLGFAPIDTAEIRRGVHELAAALELTPRSVPPGPRA
jgi:GntR family transcriptional regulator/MocR family aminotransferase